MTQYLRFLACCLLLSFGHANAQQLITDDHLTNIPTYQMHTSVFQHSLSRSASPDTLPFSAAQPFFDDFSYGYTIPDSSKWFIGGSERYPLISRRMAVRPPSRGVMTFDGLNSSGEVYVDDALAAGNADALRTHCIDLSGFSVADNIKLSFFLQPQGRGNAPENIAPGNIDEFKVYFADNRDPGSGTDNLREVFSIPGRSLTEFKQYVIPLDNPAYFHSGFYIMFESMGALYGNLDHWHLDYVYMAPNRSNADTIFNDVSVLYLDQSPIAPYTAIPFEQYKNDTYMQPLKVWVSNLNGNNTASAIDAVISEGVSQTGFPSGNRLVQALNQPPFSRSIVNFSDQFLDQAITKNASFQLDIDIEAGDNRPENDKIREVFRIDSVFAYDDGEADGAFGLNKSRGFGVQFDLPSPDSLVAVWMSFVPTVNCRTNDCGSVEYTEDLAFRLTVWSDAHPDSTQYRQISGSRVNFGDSLNHFVRFPLDIIQGVPQRFWVGVQQLSSRSLGVGYDLTYDNDAYTYWDSAGFWVKTRLNGTLMIRAEMKNGRNLSTSVIDPSIISPLDISVYPNPLSGRKLHLNISGQNQIRSHQLSMWNLKGEKIYQTFVSSHTNSLKIPSYLSAGMYIIKHDLTLTDGSQDVITDKLLIQ